MEKQKKSFNLVTLIFIGIIIIFIIVGLISYCIKNMNIFQSNNNIIFKNTDLESNEVTNIVLEPNEVFYEHVTTSLYVEWSGFYEIYIVDLNQNDKNIEIVTYGIESSDYPVYRIYSKSANGIIESYSIGP